MEREGLEPAEKTSRISNLLFQKNLESPHIPFAVSGAVYGTHHARCARQYRLPASANVETHVIPG